MNNKEKIKPIKLSPSTLNLFLECPRCFWLHIVKGVKRPSGPFPSLPSGMDKILKEHFDSFMEKGELPPELKEEDSVKGCSLFNDKEKLKEWRSNFKGIPYTDPKSGVLLHGAVDNILVKGKKLIVLDYKTRGYPLKEDTHKHYQTQMDLYNFLLRKNGHETKDYTYLLFYHPDRVLESGKVVFNTDLIKIKTDPKEGEKVFLDAVKCLKGKEPKINKECEWCGWNQGKK
ncbi:MAG: PD-(D/E)XK nuclease family protein [Nanoarchaeota archaeon]|nr:PD-(D/E)XK nuclease family protein [Nanoarchaeota archaeon]